MPRLQKLDRMLYAIGWAIYEYQFVEEATLRAIQAPFENPFPYEMAFFHLQGTGRLRFMDKVFEQFLSRADQKRWEKLRKALIIVADDRNAFAHHQIIHVGPIVTLKPSLFDRSRYGEGGASDPKDEPYTVEDIKEAVERFRALASELRDFADSIHRDALIRAGRAVFRQPPTPPQAWSLPETRRSRARKQREKERQDEVRRSHPKAPKKGRPVET